MPGYIILRILLPQLLILGLKLSQQTAASLNKVKRRKFILHSLFWMGATRHVYLICTISPLYVEILGSLCLCIRMSHHLWKSIKTPFKVHLFYLRQHIWYTNILFQILINIIMVNISFDNLKQQKITDTEILALKKVMFYSSKTIVPKKSESFWISKYIGILFIRQ